ncbi:hypothetical protein M8C21_030842, partial [Ambrosia artemisiifolia]
MSYVIDLTGNKVGLSVEGGHMLARDFDYTEEEETQIVNLDEETEGLDIHNFVGDLRALMVEDSDDVVVLDSDDDEVISEPKDGRVRGCLWRRVSAVGTQSTEVKSSAGSNLADKVTDNAPNSLQADTRHQEVLTGVSSEKRLISNNDNLAKVDQDQKTNCNNFEIANGTVDESQEPGESTQANALRFVDHYLSVSVENTSPEVKIPKTNGLRSPFTSFAKGSRDLAKKAYLKNQIDISTFDWNGNHPDYGGKLHLEKEKEHNIQKEIHLDGRAFDQRFEEELPKCPSVDDMFDVSFNTQMAAEVMESFLYAPPPTIDANENEDMNNPKQFSSPLRDVINLNPNGDTKNQKELNMESSTGNLKAQDKSLKVVAKRKQNQDLEKENIRFVYKRRESFGVNQKVKTFSPVATRTRCGSSAKVSKRIDNSSNHEYITHDKQAKILHKRKTDDLDTVSGSIKFETWNWPKKKRTPRNTRQNAALSGNRISVVGPGKTEGNFREAFLMSGVKRKPRSASKYRSTAGNKFWKGSLMQNVGQPNFAEVTNTKWVSMGIKKISTCSPGNELTRLGFTESSPDSISKDLRQRRKKVEIRVLFSQNLDDDVVKQQRKLSHLSDAKKEKEIGFNMSLSLSRARSRPLLKDQRVFITSNVEPDREMIKKLVKAGQGQVMEVVQQASMAHETSDSLLILSCEKDYEECVPFLNKGAAVYSAELLLNGIIVQKLDYARHQLFNGHVKMKQYARKRRKNGIQHIHG